MSSHEDLAPWKISHSKYIVNDKFLRLRSDSCVTPEGGVIDDYYVLEIGDWVNCIAIDADGNVVLLRHYRHGVQKYLMEFIGGGVEGGESPEDAARREAREETGYVGGSFFHVGTSYPNPASHTNQVHSYLAIGGRVGQGQDLEVGETLRVEQAPFQTVVEEMSKPGSVHPALYLAALFHAMNFIRTSQDPAVAYLKRYVMDSTGAYDG